MRTCLSHLCGVGLSLATALLVSACSSSSPATPLQGDPYASTGPPSISWTSPSPLEGATVSGLVKLETWSYKTTTAFVKVDFLVDGSIMSTQTSGGSLILNVIYLASWDTTTSSDGPHVLLARVTDKINRTADTPAFNVIVRNH